MLDSSRPVRIVFLDRDGVLSRALIRDGLPYAPLRLAEFDILAEAAPALQRLKQAGFLLVVVTNQPEVARGSLPLEVLEQMHDEVRRTLPVDEILSCCHDGDACDCRKPKPGLLLKAAASRGAHLSACFMVGDRWRDVEAGANAGCRTILIDRGYTERAPRTAPDAVVRSLPEAADWILAAQR